MIRKAKLTLTTLLLVSVMFLYNSQSTAQDEESLPSLFNSLSTGDYATAWRAAISLSKLGNDAVQPLNQVLLNGNVFAKRASAFALGRIGDEAISALPALIQALEDKDPEMRFDAINAITAIRKDPETTLPLLINLLSDDDQFVRTYAAHCLGQYGQQAKDAVSKLGEAAFDRSEFVSKSAMKALGSIGSASVPVLIEALKSKDYKILQNAYRAIAQIGPDAKDALPALIASFAHYHIDDYYFSRAVESIGPEAIPVLTNALKNKNFWVRYDAAGALASFGPAARDALPALFESMGHYGFLGNNAYQFVNKMGLDAAPLLIETLHNDDPKLRAFAAYSLSCLKTIPSDALPGLLQTLKDKDPGVRRSTVTALFRLGLPQPELLSYLVDSLDDENENVRIELYKGLISATIYKGNYEYVFKALEDKSPKVRGETMRNMSLTLLKPEFYPAFLKLLEDEDEQVYKVAIDIIFNNQTIPSAPHFLIAKLLDKSYPYRIRIIDALIIKRKVPEAIPAFTELLDDEKPLIQLKAAQALLQMNPNDENSINTLEGLLGSQDQFLRFNAALLLADYAPKPQALPILLEEMRKNNRTTFVGSIRILYKFGPRPPVIKALVNLLHHPYITISHEARDELIKLGPGAFIPVRLALKDENPDVRRAAAIVISYTAPTPEEALQVLKEAVKDEAPDVRRVAIMSIGRLKMDSSYIAPLLSDMLDDEALECRMATAMSLIKLDPDSINRVMPIVLEFIRLKSGEGYGFWYRSFEELTPPPDYTEDLIYLLDSGNISSIRLSCMLLGNIGPDAIEAVAKLQLIKEYSPWTMPGEAPGEFADWAIKKIEGNYELEGNS